MRCGFCLYFTSIGLKTGVIQHINLPHIRLRKVVCVGVEGEANRVVMSLTTVQQKKEGPEVWYLGNQKK